MKKRLIFYKFSQDSLDAFEKDIEDFLSLIENVLSKDISTLSEYDIVSTFSIKEDFYIILSNFEKFMHYANINEKWQLIDNYNQAVMDIVEKTKKLIQTILIKGILNSNYINLIFEFNKHRPFLSSIEKIYKLLINSFVGVIVDDDIDMRKILSFYLMHAVTYNNSDAIRILIEEYHASPMQSWPVWDGKTNCLKGMAIPIVQLTNAKKFHGICQQNLNIFWQEQENNFIFMLQNIDFSDASIKLWKIQEIFRSAFKSKFHKAIDYLLMQQDFCANLVLTEEDLVMMAFSFVAVPDYKPIIDTILNKDNLLKTVNLKTEDTLKKLNQHISLLQSMINITTNCDKFEHLAIKVSLDVLINFFDRNPENEIIANMLLAAKVEQEKLQQENQHLLQKNLDLEAIIVGLQEKLDSENRCSRLSPELFFSEQTSRLLNSVEVKEKISKLMQKNSMTAEDFDQQVSDKKFQTTFYVLQSILIKTKQKLEELQSSRSASLEVSSSSCSTAKTEGNRLSPVSISPHAITSSPKSLSSGSSCRIVRRYSY